MHKTAEKSWLKVSDVMQYLVREAAGSSISGHYTAHNNRRDIETLSNNCAVSL